MQARAQRRIGETKMNKQSSRSHCLFTLNVKAKKQYPDGVMEVNGKLHMVDLAGSECAKTAALDKADKATAARERERMNINRSLLTLGRVISCLKEQAEKKSGSVRVPYRDSKLTRVLQESLGGRCKTVIIATLSPSISAIEESISTLNYAQSANSIVNKPVATSYLSVGSGATAGGMGKAVEGNQSLEHWHEMECRLQYMQAQVEEAQGALARKHMQQQEIVQRAETAEKKNEELTEALAETKTLLKKSSFALKSTQNTEEKLGEAVKTLLMTLKASINDGVELHTALTDKAQHERLCKGEAKTFSTESYETADGVAKEIASLNDFASTAINESLAASKAGADRQNACLGAISELVSQIKEGVSSFKANTSTVLTDDVMSVCSDLQSSTSDKVDAIVKTFEDGERLLETEIDQGVKEANAGVDKLKGEVKEDFEAKLSEATESGKAAIGKVADDVDSIQSKLSSALEENKEKKTALASQINNLLSSLREEVESGFTGLKESCDEISDSVKSSLAHYEKNTPHDSLAKENEALQASTKAFSDSMSARISAQNAALASQRSMLSQQREEQAAAQQKFVESVMEGMAALMAEQKTKLEALTASHFTASSAFVDTSSAEVVSSSGLIDGHVSSTGAGLAKVGDLVKEGKDLDGYVGEKLTAVAGSVNSLSESADNLRSEVSAKEEDVKGKIEEDRGHDSSFRGVADGAVGELGELGGVGLREEASSCVGKGLASVGDAGAKALEEAAKALGEAAKNMSTMKDPRENVRESVVDGAKLVTSELSVGIEGVKGVAARVVGDMDKMEEEERGQTERAEEELKREMKEIDAGLSEAEKNGQEAVAKIAEHASSAAAGITSIHGGIRRYAEEVVRVDEEVSAVGPRKFFGVSEVVHATPTALALDEAYGDGEDASKISSGAAPVAVPVSVGIASLMSIDERVSERAREAAERRRQENDENREASGVQSKPRRRSAARPEAVNVLGESVSVEKVNSPKRKSVEAGKKGVDVSAPSVKVGRASSPKPSKGRKVSPRPSTAGGASAKAGRKSVAGAGSRRTPRNAGQAAVSRDI